MVVVSTYRKKKQTSQKVEKRVSSLRREFGNVKKESYHNDDDWLGKRLENDFDEEEFIISKRK